MDKKEFLSVVYSGITPGLIIQTNSSYSQVVGIDTNRNIEYLFEDNYKNRISEDEWIAVYGELSTGKITNNQIRKIVGTSKTSNAGVIKWVLTKFGLAFLNTKNIWIAAWQLEPHLVLNEQSTLALLDRSGEIVSVNKSWSNFALANGGDVELSKGIGINYLDVCNSSAEHFCSDAICAYDGIKSVVEGSTNIYTQHYTCHSEQEKRWYVMFVWQFADQYTRISHVAVEFSI
jgi:hypothetical protein